MTAQELLARLLIDPELADELRADPAAFATRHGSDRGTARVLAALPHSRMRVATAITEGKRQHRIVSMFSGTFAVAQDARTDAALVRAGLSRATLDSPEDSLAVGHLLADVAAGLPDGAATELLREMIRFETLWYRAKAGMRSAEPEAPPGAPRMRRGVELAVFSCPITEVRRLVLDGRPTGELPTGTTCYLLSATANAYSVRSHRVPPKLAALLSACDGESPAETVAHRAGLDLPHAVGALRSMAAKGFLSWAEPQGGPEDGAAVRETVAADH